MLSQLLFLIPRTQSLSHWPLLEGHVALDSTLGHTCLYSNGWPLDSLVDYGKQTELFSTNSVFSKELFLIPLSCVLPKFLKYCSWRFFCYPPWSPDVGTEPMQLVWLGWLSQIIQCLNSLPFFFFNVIILENSGVNAMDIKCKGWGTSSNIGE